MVGEIIDAETARLATQAALTGHLVISSLHTNTAWRRDTFNRYGNEPFLISAALKGVIGQRLIKSYALVAGAKEKQRHQRQ